MRLEQSVKLPSLHVKQTWLKTPGPALQRIVVPSSLGTISPLFLYCLCPEGTTIFWNVRNYITTDTAHLPRRLESSATLRWETHIFWNRAITIDNFHMFYAWSLTPIVVCYDSILQTYAPTSETQFLKSILFTLFHE